MGSDVEDLGLVRGIFQDLRHLLQVKSEGGALIFIGDMVDDTLDFPNPGGFTPQGGHSYDGNATTV